MAWQAFKFLVWFCKWRHARNLKAAEWYYRRARLWQEILMDVGDKLAARRNAKVSRQQ